MTYYNKFLLATAFSCLSGISVAATAVSDNFDAGIGTWSQNTVQTIVSHSLAGGNPNGFLRTTNDPTSFGLVGAVNTTADYSGEFADGIWNISVDLSFINGDFTDSWLRFRYKDFSHNGWYISLENSAFFDSQWQSYSISFDTTWDDATAAANGWVQEATSSSFSELWNDVYTTEVRILGRGGMVAGIDNYNASLSAVPVPAAVFMFAPALLGFLGLRRKVKNVTN